MRRALQAKVASETMRAIASIKPMSIKKKPTRRPQGAEGKTVSVSEAAAFALKERVILADGMSGVVVGIRQTFGATMYEVATVKDGERKTSYFYGFELRK